MADSNDQETGLSVFLVIDWKLTDADVCYSLRELWRDLQSPNKLACDSLQKMAGLRWGEFLAVAKQQTGISVCMVRTDHYYYSEDRYALGRMKRRYWSHSDNYDATLAMAYKWADELNQDELARYQKQCQVNKHLTGQSA